LGIFGNPIKYSVPGTGGFAVPNEINGAGAEQSSAVSEHYNSAHRRALLCASRRNFENLVSQ
jgi:hypothetical protein